MSKINIVRDVIVKRRNETAFRRVTVELPIGENLVSINPDRHYKLGYPLEDDVVLGHIISAAQQTHWCPISQKWEDTQ